MTDPAVHRGRYYPDMPPMLPGEDAAAYTDRLTGADRTDRRPYDHPRNRQCSIGWHGECSDPAGERCKCPCHTDPTMPTGPSDGAVAIAEAAMVGRPPGRVVFAGYESAPWWWDGQRVTPHAPDDGDGAEAGP